MQLQKVEKLTQIIKQVRPTFEELAMIHGAVNWKSEVSFAIQHLKANSYLASQAEGNPDSLKQAVINVAAIGLTLNPAQKLAYLVPRDRRVCLDISYQGYVHLATECGALKWAVADVVREKDTFIYKGIGHEPEHIFEPFGTTDRGKITGTYCLAKTHGGEFIVTLMDIEQVHGIRNRSAAWKAYERDKSKVNPWVTDEAEMFKKTVIKRAYKSWPKTDSRSRLAEAVELSNQSDPIDVGPILDTEDPRRAEGIQLIRDTLEAAERSEEKFIEHLVRTNKRDIKTLDDLTTQEVNEANAFLAQLGGEK